MTLQNLTQFTQRFWIDLTSRDFPPQLLRESMDSYVFDQDFLLGFREVSKVFDPQGQEQFLLLPEVLQSFLREELEKLLGLRQLRTRIPIADRDQHPPCLRKGMMMIVGQRHQRLVSFHRSNSFRGLLNSSIPSGGQPKRSDLLYSRTLHDERVHCCKNLFPILWTVQGDNSVVKEEPTPLVQSRYGYHGMTSL